MTTPTTEEYLEVISMLASEGQMVKGARLARTLRVSRPTVTATLRRLARDGLIKINARKDIELTKRGFQTADDLLRRHRIVERWLTDVLGFDWAKSDAEAHRLEHAMSDDIVKRLNELLGHPLTCPHGNPIPGNERAIAATLAAPQVFQLAQAKNGDCVRVTRISEYAENVAELLNYLGERGLRPGAQVTIADRASAHDSLALKVNDKHFALSPQIAEYVWVTKA